MNTGIIVSKADCVFSIAVLRVHKSFEEFDMAGCSHHHRYTLLVGVNCKYSGYY